ncbi:hypothetical protein BT93_D0777 [Corymbia citriodora subsp. variegata]|nr:hypothetical protein BT93_D0777 [Corymbia citriodora subsp. variegata]
MTCQMWARVVVEKARDNIQKSNRRSKSVGPGSCTILISASLLAETDQLSTW